MLKRSSKERSGLRMTNSFFNMLMWIAATAASRERKRFPNELLRCRTRHSAEFYVRTVNSAPASRFGQGRRTDTFAKLQVLLDCGAPCTINHAHS